MAAATKLNRKAKATQLDTYELTDSVSRNILIGSVKQMFERGTIQNPSRSRHANKAYAEKAVNIKPAKRLAGDMA